MDGKKEPPEQTRQRSSFSFGVPANTVSLPSPHGCATLHYRNNILSDNRRGGGPACALFLLRTSSRSRDTASRLLLFFAVEASTSTVGRCQRVSLGTHVVFSPLLAVVPMTTLPTFVTGARVENFATSFQHQSSPSAHRERKKELPKKITSHLV